MSNGSPEEEYEDSGIVPTVNVIVVECRVLEAKGKEANEKLKEYEWPKLFIMPPSAGDRVRSMCGKGVAFIAYFEHEAIGDEGATVVVYLSRQHPDGRQYIFEKELR